MKAHYFITLLGASALALSLAQNSQKTVASLKAAQLSSFNIDNNNIEEKTFIVPSNFQKELRKLSSLSANASTLKILQSLGVKFSKGTSLSLVGNKLIMKNTEENIALLESIINKI